ncbi:uncharacterized protein LOC133866188 [Alnus glutinosa]|uniref:uncharacterized protein LOC133866188 n=1 Tax=Alnus glutinosa TaxID=3517 RepID=UPI002D7863C6|nr:uncharacterized protein LOC133866188 [Alnus glutinosa]
MTPFEVVYGVPPPRLLSYILGTTRVQAVEEVLRNREQILKLLHHNLKHAQQRMKKYADIQRTERTFELGQAVYLRLQPYRHTLVTHRRALKLAPRFYGPFTTIRKVGEVAYELDLPLESQIHPVFHVSQLKPKLGSSSSVVPKLPPVDSHGVFQPEPVEVLDRHSRPHNNRTFIELLVRWEGQTADDATWEEFHSLENAYPHLAGKSALLLLQTQSPYKSRYLSSSSISNQVVEAEDDVAIASSGISLPLSEILKELNKKVPDSLFKVHQEDGFSMTYIPWYKYH